MNLFKKLKRVFTNTSNSAYFTNTSNSAYEVWVIDEYKSVPQRVLIRQITALIEHIPNTDWLRHSEFYEKSYAVENIYVSYDEAAAEMTRRRKEVIEQMKKEIKEINKD